MPAAIRRALTTAGLMAAYRARPAYLQNDYLGWIGRAKLEATRDRRLAQMLAELRGGRVYMNMTWRARTTRAGGAGETSGLG
jgi:hypothetical protein